MDNRVVLNFVRKAGRRLKLLHLSFYLQLAIFAGLTAAVLLLLASRLFMLPYYEFYAYAAAGLAAIACLLYSLRKLPGRARAVDELDFFTPHNQLLTVWQAQEKNPLTVALAGKTAENMPYSYELFKNRWNHWFHWRWLLASVISASLLLILLLFPSSLQENAKEIEEEREIIGEMEKRVEEMEQQAETELVKKELEELKESLEQTESAEQALQEMVKKQKELALQQEQTAETDPEAGEAASEDMQKAAEGLAQQAGESQTALSNMGKPVSFPLQQAIKNNNPGDSDGDSVGSSGASGEGEEVPGSESGEEAGDPAESEGAGEGSADGEGQEGEESSGSGSGEGSADGEGGEPGEGQAQGSGSGEGQGSGTGGQGSGQGEGAGTGQGSRDLLTVPSRIGGSGKTAVDSGELGDGEAADEQKGIVSADRGTVRSYEDIVGSYNDSYFSSAERMQLPPDLQKAVEQYFSSIESE